MAYHFFKAKNFQILGFTWKTFYFFCLSKAITMIFYSLLKDSTNWASACPRLAKSEFWMILVVTLLIYLQRVLNQVKAYMVLVATETFLLRQVICVKVFQTKVYIFFASNIIVSRLSFTHLNNTSPRCPITNIDRECFFPNSNELKTLRENFKILVGRTCVQFLTKFKFLKSIVTRSTEHKFSKEMTQISSIVSPLILNCNENNYHDCVTILQTYEKWIFEIYQKGGLINEYPYMLQTPNLPDSLVCSLVHMYYQQGMIQGIL